MKFVVKTLVVKMVAVVMGAIVESALIPVAGMDVVVIRLTAAHKSEIFEKC